MASLLDIASRYRRELELDKAPLQPDVREKELEEKETEIEDLDLRRGAVLSATIQAGDGERPKPGDLVFLHIGYADSSGVVQKSTRSDQDGSGIPEPFILGKDNRLLRGIHLAVEGMHLGERCLLTIQPNYAFEHKDSIVAPPVGLDPGQPVMVDVQLTYFYPKLGIRNVAPSLGIYKRITKPVDSWESPRAPFEVRFRVRAYAPTTSGEFSESNLLFETKESIVAQLGFGTLPEGVELALGSMKIGEEAVVFCPSKLLPPTELLKLPKADFPLVNLAIELEDFKQIRDLADDGGVIKRIIRKGKGIFPMDSPVEDASIVAHWRIRNVGDDSWLYDSRAEHPDGVHFDTGMKDVPDAVDLAVRLMLPEELSLLRVKWKYSFEGRSDAPKGIKEGLDTEFEVELISFKSDRHWHQAEPTERLRIATHFKEQGNTLYKRGEYKLAKVKYLKATKVVDRSMQCDTAEEQDKADELMATCRVNLAQCAIRTQEYGEAVFWSNKAIEDRPTHAKAFLRHAIAISYLGHLDEAKQELEYAVKLDPKLEPTVARELAAMERRERDGDAKAKGEFGSFFRG